MNLDRKELGTFAADIVKEAGALLLKLKNEPLECEEKWGHSDLVTNVDRMVEKFLADKILAKYPDHGIVGEEGVVEGGSFHHETLWVIDSIDGTTNFIHNFPFYGISIGIVYKGEGIIGVVYNPSTNELFYAEKDHGAFVNGNRLLLNESILLKQALVASTMFWEDLSTKSALHPGVIEIYKRTRGLRMVGGAAISLCEIAKGTLNAYVVPMLSAWDYAGLPSLDSVYWKIPAYDQTGKPFAKFSRKAEAEIKKGIKYAVQNRVRDLNHHRKIDLMDLLELDTVAELIQKAERIAVLAGAGLSTSSGIPDYRSAAEGLWKKDPSLLKDLDQSTFEYDPERFWRSFYKLMETSLAAVVSFPTESALLTTIEAIAPNNGHQFFAWLEKELGKSVRFITQNVDNLEKQAGITNVIQMHGNIHEVICPVCQKTYPLKRVLNKEHVPRCKCHAVLRPNVVFFGDQVNGFDEAQKIVQSADLILIVGTSLDVYPFNELPFLKSGAKTVLLNGTRSDFYLIDHTLQGEISTICWKLREKIQGVNR